jgi:hypothetical protein
MLGFAAQPFYSEVLDQRLRVWNKRADSVGVQVNPPRLIVFEWAQSTAVQTPLRDDCQGTRFVSILKAHCTTIVKNRFRFRLVHRRQRINWVNFCLAVNPDW